MRFHASVVAGGLNAYLHRDLFVALALKFSELPQPEAIDLSCSAWPELLLCRGDYIKLVIVQPRYPSLDQRRIEIRRRLLQHVCEPLGIEVDTITIVPARESKNILPIEEQMVVLKAGPPKKIGRSKVVATWESPLTAQPLTVEEAVLDWYRMQGWRGCWGERDIIEVLLECAGLAPGPLVVSKNRKKIDSVSIDSIKRKFKMKWRVYAESYPGVTEESVIELYRLLGPERTIHIAANFTRDGWPDLMLLLYKEDDLMFVEVKSPGDKLQESQEVIMHNVLSPIGVKFQIAKILLPRN